MRDIIHVMPDRWEVRIIWQWQSGRYLDDGYCVGWDCATINPLSWPGAFLSWLSPTATKVHPWVF